jgi:SpoVK/Ycf46/Vps4 family AAA+-type ATPase
VSTSGELVRELILAHTENDEDAFERAARKLVAEERKKQHDVFASDLERILSTRKALDMPISNSKSKSLSLLDARVGDLPKDSERGAVLVEIIDPSRSIEDLVLAQDVKESLSRILLENRHADLLHSYGVRPVNKILFCGPPGCGKTVAAETMAKGLYLPLVLVRFDAVVSSYLGETAANLRKVFDFAGTRPLVMLFDEFDAIGKSRTTEEEHGELKRVVNSFLQMLDAFKGDAIIIAATNHQGLLDSALWRRFDEIVYFDRPDVTAIHELLICNLRQIGISASVQLTSIAKTLVGVSHADVERIARDAIKQTVIEDRKEVQPDVLKQAIARQKNRICITLKDNCQSQPRNTKSKPVKKKL